MRRENGGEKMIRVLLFGLVILAICAAVFAVLYVAVRIEEEKEQKRRERAFMCKSAVRSGDCPKDCSMCEWGGYDN